MKKFIQNIKNIWKVEELKKRILITLFLILIFRLGSFIVIPGVNYTNLSNYNSTNGSNVLTDLLSLFSGGGFSNASIMALGIMPYISASIIMQLLGIAVPAVQKMQKEGESGRKKINNYTRILTVIICAIQAPAYLTAWVGSRGALPVGDALNTLWWIQSVIVMVAGSMFAVWLGERITDRGIGNGISLLITVGIMSRLPGSLIAEFSVNSGNLIKIVLEFVVFILIILATILIVQGVRKIPINVAKRIVGNNRGGNVAEQSSRSYLPIKVNATGVMPIIFAQAIVTIPMMIMSGASTESPGWFQTAFSNIYGIPYNLLLAILIIVFTYFYTAIMINPSNMADDLKRNGGFIPGVKPGEETADYIDSLITRITLPGSVFLAIIAILPAIAHSAGITSGFELFFGGTSLLIMVGVVLDTLQQIESYLLNKQMDGLVDGTRVRGRRLTKELSDI